MGLITLLALVYIHMQMQIVDLAYQENADEMKIRGLIEENGNLTYKILSLKSVNHLGIKMLEEDSYMDFVGPENIMHISLSEGLIKEDHPERQLSSKRKKGNLFGLFFPEHQAEARTQD